MGKKFQGLSLIEMVIAMALLSVVLAGLMGIFWQGGMFSRKSEEYGTSWNLAREAVEKNFNTTFNATCSTALNSTYNITWSGNGTAGNTSDTANITYNVTFNQTNATAYGNYNGSLRFFNVTINWTSAGKPHSLLFSTKKAGYN